VVANATVDEEVLVSSWAAEVMVVDHSDRAHLGKQVLTELKIIKSMEINDFRGHFLEGFVK
jgi:hypothetical protein